METSESLAKYGLHLWELHVRARPWDGKAACFFYISMASDVAVHALTLLHYAHILLIHGISFLDALILLDMRLVFNGLRARLAHLRNYRLVCTALNTRYADATAAELHALDDVCVICRDPMQTAKKLPCGHMFHSFCLRTWLESHHNCPTCRRELLELPPRAPPPAPARVHFNRHPHHFHPAQHFRQFHVSPRAAPPTAPPSASAAAAGAAPVAGPAGGATVPAARRRDRESSVFAFTSERWPTSWLLPSFSVEVVRSNGAATQPAAAALEHMTRICQEMFPHVDAAVLRADLMRTRSVELTTENIVEGRLPQLAHLHVD